MITTRPVLLFHKMPARWETLTYQSSSIHIAIYVAIFSLHHINESDVIIIIIINLQHIEFSMLFGLGFGVNKTSQISSTFQRILAE